MGSLKVKQTVSWGYIIDFCELLLHHGGLVGDE